MIKEEKMLAYPYNFLYHVYNHGKPGEFDTEWIDIDGYNESFYTLTSKERQYILSRFVNGMTYEQVAKKAGVSTERARQVVERACKKMRHPSRQCMYDVRAMKDHKEKIEKEKELLKDDLDYKRERNKDEINGNLNAVRAALENQSSRVWIYRLCELEKLDMESSRGFRTLASKACFDAVAFTSTPPYSKRNVTIFTIEDMYTLLKNYYVPKGFEQNDVVFKIADILSSKYGYRFIYNVELDKVFPLNILGFCEYPKVKRYINNKNERIYKIIADLVGQKEGKDLEYKHVYLYTWRRMVKLCPDLKVSQMTELAQFFATIIYNLPDDDQTRYDTIEELKDVDESIDISDIFTRLLITSGSLEFIARKVIADVAKHGTLK